MIGHELVNAEVLIGTWAFTIGFYLILYMFIFSTIKNCQKRWAIS